MRQRLSSWHLMHAAVFTLRGHTAPLVRVLASPDTSEVVTADVTGIIKIWDVRCGFPL